MEEEEETLVQNVAYTKHINVCMNTCHEDKSMYSSDCNAIVHHKTLKTCNQIRY